VDKDQVDHSKEKLRTLPQKLVGIFIEPIFPFLQKVVQSVGIMREAPTLEGAHRRQPYLIRMMRPDETTEILITRLESVGFSLHDIALNDPGQLVSMRRLDEKYPDRQFHIRIFNDGEIRGHYELTPEDHPMDHWNEKLFEPSPNFLTWLEK
jgi:hypothetical protein